MTDSNVVSLHGGPIESDRKALFLETVAEAFDKFVTENGEIPDGIVFAMGGVAQSTACWAITDGRSEDCSRAFSSLAIMSLTRWLFADDD